MVSVVTPSFRQLDWLKLCAASVADQTGVEVEHIVQDAGSGPDLEAWAQTQPQLQLFVEADEGMYDGINRGLAKARGDICAYLNCDEQYLPGTLAKVTAYFHDNPKTDILFGDFVLVDQEFQILSYRRTVLPDRAHIRTAHLNTTTCATFFRRGLLDRGFFFETKWKAIGDAVWIDSLLAADVKMAVLQEPLAVFTLTSENLGASPISGAESEEWKAAGAATNPLTRLALIARHRWKKAFAGAYRPRRVEIDIYTRRSPAQRQHIVSERVGFGWPTANTSEATR